MLPSSYVLYKLPYVNVQGTIVSSCKKVAVARSKKRAPWAGPRAESRLSHNMEGDMSLQSKTASAVLGLLLAVAFGLQAGAMLPQESPSVPLFQTVKSIDYSRPEGTKQSDAIGYRELQELINACQAYSKGLEALPQYHERIPTRGESGTAVFKKVSPSVVMILTANFKNDQISESGLGAGIIIDPSGYVLTNWHVIHGFESGVAFLKPAHGTEPDKNAAYGLRFIAQDEQADLALVKMIKPPAGLVPVKLGEASSIQVAEDIHVIGHPHGLLWSYTTGVVSQVRDNYDWKYSDGSEHSAKVLQLQTAINPGNSGGPVLDDNANMLGLVAMSEEGQNLDYAVAVDVIKAFLTNSKARRTRGAATHAPAEQGTVYLGKTKSGFSVTRTSYSNLVSYLVRDSGGATVELFAETSEGATLTGRNPTAFGGFSDWSYKPISGKTVSVKSSGVAPDVITAATAE